MGAAVFRAEDPDQPAGAAHDEEHGAEQNRNHRSVRLGQPCIANATIIVAPRTPQPAIEIGIMVMSRIGGSA